jgi:hypothetical protein
VKIYARPMDGAGVSKSCNDGHHRFIESGVEFGHNVTLRSADMLWEGTRFRTVYLSDLRSCSPIIFILALNFAVC